jgi:hypothetical protein
MEATNPYTAWFKRAQRWREENTMAADCPPDYPPFEVFPSGSVNLGLRLVYRQDWRLLGTQPGEIVRTIPLGPGQTERVTTKIIRRHKRTTSLETTTSVETQTETSESTKDSSEIVNEAMKAWDLSHSHEANVSWGVLSAKGSTSIGYKDEDRSKETSSSLSEAMRKTAEKIRRDTKVTISTESEQTVETEQFSEIKNPNNEIAITYEYHKLQHQYEVFTRLAEMQMVVFVAEDLPTAEQLCDATYMERLLRENDWILAKVLKDESYRETLNELSQHVSEAQDSDLDGKSDDMQVFASMHATAKDKFAKFEVGEGSQGGLSIPDIYAEPQRIYQQELRAREERRRAHAVWRQKLERLFTHIRQNLLYYFQAIWAHEPPDQRLLRYKKEGRRVPIEWRGPIALIQEGGATSPPSLAGFPPTGREAELWEIIDPTGPIGYIGNYAVFGLKPLADHWEISQGSLLDRRNDDRVIAGVQQQGELVIGINEVLGELAKPYTDGNGSLKDPAWDLFQREAKKEKPGRLRQPTDEEVYNFISYLPRLADQLLDDNGDVIRGANGELQRPISYDEWGEYLYRKNNTRRFLVDSNNVYLNIRASGGAALEPFKRAHRYLDVLRAAEELRGERLKNIRRANLVGVQLAFDPDIEKVVIIGNRSDNAGVLAATTEALGERAQQASEVGEP